MLRFNHIWSWFFSFCSYGMRVLHVSTSYYLKHYHPGQVTIAVCNYRGRFQTHLPVFTVFVSHYLAQAGLELYVVQGARVTGVNH